MDRGVKSCIYCHPDIDETAQRFHGGCNCPPKRHKECPAYKLFVPVCKAIASSIKSWRGFIDIMTVNTRFYSTIYTCRIGSLVLGISTFTFFLYIKTNTNKPTAIKSTYPKSSFSFSFQHRVVDESIVLFSNGCFLLQRDTSSDYKDIRSRATTLQFQTVLLD